MSLEQKIEKLSMAVSMLTNVIANHPSNFTTAGANVATTVVAEVKEVVETVGNVSVKTTASKTTQTAEETDNGEPSEETKAMADRINEKTKAKALAKAKKAVDALIEEKPPEVEEVSADDLKAACLTAARSAPDAKAKVKALLKEFDATVVKDVAVADRATVLARLENSEF